MSEESVKTLVFNVLHGVFPTPEEECVALGRTTSPDLSIRQPLRLYRTLNHLRDGIWSHHGQQTALLEIELSLLEFAVSITRSVHAIELSVVRDRISPSVS